MLAFHTIAQPHTLTSDMLDVDAYGQLPMTCTELVNLTLQSAYLHHPELMASLHAVQELYVNSIMYIHQGMSLARSFPHLQLLICPSSCLCFVDPQTDSWLHDPCHWDMSVTGWGSHCCALATLLHCLHVAPRTRLSCTPTRATYKV